MKWAQQSKRQPIVVLIRFSLSTKSRFYLSHDLQSFRIENTKIADRPANNLWIGFKFSPFLATYQNKSNTKSTRNYKISSSSLDNAISREMARMYTGWKVKKSPRRTWHFSVIWRDNKTRNDREETPTRSKQCKYTVS